MADFYFIYLFYFIFFSEKLFYFWEISKSNYRFWRVMTTPIQRCEQIWAAISNGGPGGRQAPPASKCHKKNVGCGGSHHPATDCVDWAYLSVVGVRTNNPRDSETTPKKQKFPSYLKNPKNQKSSEKNENHAVGYSNYQQLEKNNEKNIERMREILGAYRKKPITQKVCYEISKYRYLNGALSRKYCGLSESIILFEIGS